MSPSTQVARRPNIDQNGSQLLEDLLSLMEKDSEAYLLVIRNGFDVIVELHAKGKDDNFRGEGWPIKKEVL